MTLIPRTMLATCMFASGVCLAQTSIQRISAPFSPPQQRVALPVAPAQTESRPPEQPGHVGNPTGGDAPAFAAAIVAEPPLELRESDRSLRNTFSRWGQDAGATVVWQLADDIPLDAVGPVPAGRSGLTATSLAESRYPKLVEAMVTIARAFSSAKAPFVVREFDNAILVLPRVEERK